MGRDPYNKQVFNINITDSHLCSAWMDEKVKLEVEHILLRRRGQLQYEILPRTFEVAPLSQQTREDTEITGGARVAFKGPCTHYTQISTTTSGYGNQPITPYHTILHEIRFGFIGSVKVTNYKNTL